MEERPLSSLQQAVQQLGERAAREDVERRKDVMITLMSAMYDKAAMYANLIIVAGYAALFAVWGTMRDTMARGEMITIALFLTISLCVFIVWEIFKMISSANDLRSWQRVLESSAEEFDQNHANTKSMLEKKHVQLMKHWRPVLIVTLGCGSIAAATLLYSFLRQLLAGH